MQDETLEGYKILKAIGKGLHGLIFLAQKDDKLYAIKSYYRWKVFHRELKFLRRFKFDPHPNIVNIEHEFQNEPSFAMDYANRGDLLELMNLRGKRFSEHETNHLFRQLVFGLIHIHKKKIVHFDLKLENILLHEPNDHKTNILNITPDTILKISDFSLSRCSALILGNEDFLSGSLHYVATELVLPSLNSMTVDSVKSGGPDLWSLGIILYIMVMFRFPCFHDESKHTAAILSDCHNEKCHYELLKVFFPRYENCKNVDEFKKCIWRMDQPDFHFEISHNLKPYVSSQLQDLVSQLLQPLPHKRITLKEIVRHPWFSLFVDTPPLILLNKIKRKRRKSFMIQRIRGGNIDRRMSF